MRFPVLKNSLPAAQVPGVLNGCAAGTRTWQSAGGKITRTGDITNANKQLEYLIILLAGLDTVGAQQLETLLLGGVATKQCSAVWPTQFGKTGRSDSTSLAGKALVSCTHQVTSQPFHCWCSQLRTRSGEVVIDYLTQVEDTKGNNGERGVKVA